MIRRLDRVKCYRVVKIYLKDNKLRRARGTHVAIGTRVYSAIKPSFAWAFDLAEKKNGGVWSGEDSDGSRWIWDIHEIYYDGYERSTIEEV